MAGGDGEEGDDGGEDAEVEPFGDVEKCGDHATLDEFKIEIVGTRGALGGQFLQSIVSHVQVRLGGFDAVFRDLRSKGRPEELLGEPQVNVEFILKRNEFGNGFIRNGAELFEVALKASQLGHPVLLGQLGGLPLEAVIDKSDSLLGASA